MKNCGAPMHKEVATKEVMDAFRELAKVSYRLTQPFFVSSRNAPPHKQLLPSELHTIPFAFPSKCVTSDKSMHIGYKS